MSKPKLPPLAERVADMRAWAANRIEYCARRLAEIAESQRMWSLPPPSVEMAERIGERRALEAVLRMIDGVQAPHPPRKEGGA